jgi:hypothetical protein
LPRAEIIDQAKEPTGSTGLTEGAGMTLTHGRLAAVFRDR